jgi:hypothetical protein
VENGTVVQRMILDAAAAVVVVVVSSRFQWVHLIEI